MFERSAHTHTHRARTEHGRSTTQPDSSVRVHAAPSSRRCRRLSGSRLGCRATALFATASFWRRPGGDWLGPWQARRSECSVSLRDKNEAHGRGFQHVFVKISPNQSAVALKAETERRDGMRDVLKEGNVRRRFVEKAKGLRLAEGVLGPGAALSFGGSGSEKKRFILLY